MMALPIFQVDFYLNPKCWHWWVNVINIINLTSPNMISSQLGSNVWTGAWNMFSGIITVLLCCFGQLSIKKAQVKKTSSRTLPSWTLSLSLQGLLLMSLVVTVVNLINLVVLEVRSASMIMIIVTQNHYNHSNHFNHHHCSSGGRMARFSLPDWSTIHWTAWT